MQIFKEIRPFRAFLVEKQRSGLTIGFVPTMGALHEGHTSLLKSSIAQNDLTICSIYVNPTQFNDSADLENYPRTFEPDVELLQNEGCDVLFAPDNAEMYNGSTALTMDFGNLEKVMEGQYRPGHFNGVALIVSKLLHIVEPNRAYFGQKDWQQVCIIRELVNELKFNVEVCVVPTIRENDGLARSSRNMRLSDQQRQYALEIPRSLEDARSMLLSGNSFSDVKEKITHRIGAIPGMKLDYFELANSKNLNLMDRVDQQANPILCIAAFVGDVRLIDNMFVFE